MGRNDCLSSEDLTYYLGKSLATDERRRVEEHLSHCRACRRRLTEAYEAGSPLPDVQVPEDLKRSVAELPMSRPTAPYRWMALAAALVVGLGVAILQQPALQAPPEADPETLRASPQEALEGDGLELVEPTAGVISTSGASIFVWRGVPNARRYTLSIVDSLGNLTYRSTTSGMSVSLPAGTLEAGQEYFWYVTAVLDDGTTMESELRSLRSGGEGGEFESF